MQGKYIKYIIAITIILSFSLIAFSQNTPAAGSGSATGSGSPVEEEESTISLANVKIGTFLQYIAEREKIPIICEDAPIKAATFNIIPLSFKVPSSKYDQIIDTILDSTLRMKGYAIIRGEELWKVVKVSEARQHPIPINPEADLSKLPDNDAVYTQVIKLKHADANSLSGLLGTLKGRSDASYIAIPDANTLIITDYAANIKRFSNIITMVDKESDPFLTEIRKLNYASATFVKTNLDQYIAALRASVKPRPGVPVLSARVLSDERTNSVIMIAQAKDMKQLIRMVDLFDSRPVRDTEYNIYKLINTNAEDVAKIVDAIFKQQLQAFQTSLKASEKNILIQPEKTTNSLIITAPPAIYKDMVELIKKLDAKKKQVLLEVVIAELTNEKMIELGVELASIKDAGDKLSGFGGTVTGISSPTEDATGRVPRIPSGDNIAGTMTVGLWKDSKFNIPFLLQASQKNRGVDLKAAPVLLTNDNAEASINMSDMAPYYTYTYTGGATQPQQNFGGYVQAEIKLKITPFISDDDYIRLIIEQTSEQFLGPPSQDTPKTSRTAKTTVTVPDRHTIVIGGLTREVKTKVVSKVPLLGDIPLLGYLFRSTANSVNKTHLCIFIKPNIIKDTADLISKTQQIQEALEREKNSGFNK